MLNRTQCVIIAINWLLLVFFITALGTFYRLVPEDYHAVWGNHQYGPLKQAMVVCDQWGGRFFSYLFSFILIDLHEKGFSFGWYYAAGNIILTCSFYFIFSYINNRYNLPVGKRDIPALSAVAFITLFYLTPGIHESWFWAAASPSYYWGLVMAAAGTALLASEKTRIHRLLLSGMCFLYVCSASEPFALMVLLFFAAGISWSVMMKNRKTMLSLLLPFSFAITGFCLMYFSGGTQNRWQAMPDLQLSEKIMRQGGAFIKYFQLWVPRPLTASLLLAPVLLVLGSFLRTESLLGIQKLQVTIKSTFILYLLLIFFSFLPGVFVMGEAGPLRSWHHTGFYNVMLVLTVCILAGNNLKEMTGQLKKMLSVILVSVTVLHACYVFYNLQTAQRHAFAVDARIALIHELKKRDFRGTAVLERLPDSGLLFSAEIGTHKEYFLNRFLRKGLNLEFDVVVKESNTAIP